MRVEVTRRASVLKTVEADGMAHEWIANIGERGARRRMIGGAVWLILAVAIFAALVRADAPRALRLAVGVPLFFAFLGVFQARARTCVVLGAIGKRERDAGDVKLTKSERPAVWRQVCIVAARSAGAAAVSAAILYFV
jgi:hypothetical protein